MIRLNAIEPVVKGITLDLGGGVTMELVLIPAGEFLMGFQKHRVRITRPFCLGQYEVTQEQWEAVMGNNPSRFKGPQNPVDGVSWNDCQAFLKKLQEKRANHAGAFRLPTEAQWEYACRAGTRTRYSFGDDKADLGKYAWYQGNSSGQTHPVGQKKPNAWGLYDMHGNVWEWCQDYYDGDYYAASPTDDPTGPATGSSRVHRGGRWDYPSGWCCTAQRNGVAPKAREGFGFRVALVPVDASGR